MRTLISFVLMIFLIGDCLAQDLKVSLDQTHAKWLDSKLVEDKFLIQTYIPEQIKIPYDSIPMVFVLDADMSFGLVYDIVRWLTWRKEIPQVAIIGISYGTGQKDWWYKRARDYSESKDLTKRWGEWPQAGGAAKFQDFIDKELFPFLKDQYGLNYGPKTIIGLSLGGLFCTYDLFSDPKLFDNYIILGPAVIWNDKEIFKQESKFFESHKTVKANVFTAIGDLDSNDDVKQPWFEFLDQIKSRDYKELTISTWIIENETHLSMFPAGVTRGLKTILRKK